MPPEVYPQPQEGGFGYNTHPDRNEHLLIQNSRCGEDLGCPPLSYISPEDCLLEAATCKSFEPQIPTTGTLFSSPKHLYLAMLFVNALIGKGKPRRYCLLSNIAMAPSP